MNETLTKRQLKKEETRRRLIEAALGEYGRRGFAATITADIAAAAGVSHGTVFVHFPTQEDLMNAVIEAFGERVALRLHELAAARNSLKDVLTAHLMGLTEYEAFYTHLVIEGRLLPESARHTLVMIQSAISFHIGQAAEDEMNAGGIGRYPVHLLFNTWVGLIHYYIVNGDLFAPGGSVLKGYGEKLLTHFMNLIQIK